MSGRGREGVYVTKLQLAFVTILMFLCTVIGMSLGAIPQNTIAYNRGIVFPTVNATEGYFIGSQNVTVTLKYPGRSGVVENCSNGTWIDHGLAGDPDQNGSIILSLRGASRYNATIILRVPTVLQSNTTHFQVEFLAWETVGWTLVPVTPVEQQTIYWYAVWNPP